MNDTERYIHALTRVDDGKVMWCWRRDVDGGVMHTLTASCSEMFLALRNSDKLGYGIFCLVNESSHFTRRRKADICNVRAIWTDLDGVSGLPYLELEPSMVVQTRNGYHIYYILESGTSSIAWGEGMNKTLARKYGGDAKATDACRVLRVPGFYHHKVTPPYLITLLACTGLRYTQDELETALGAPQRPQERSTQSSGTSPLLSPVDSSWSPSGPSSDTSWGQAAVMKEKYKVERAPEGTRNSQLATSGFKLGQIVGTGELTWGTAEDALVRGAKANGYYGEEGEDIVLGVIRSAMDAGMLRPRPKRGV